MKYLVLFLLLMMSIPAFGQKKQSMEEILGDWTGESKCAGTNPKCHDEVVVYHLTRSKEDAKKVNMAADKIVNGKPEFMGEFDMIFDGEKMTLTVEFTIKRTGGKGVFLYKIDGDKMDGTLTVFPENEIGRKIHVERKKPDKK